MELVWKERGRENGGSKRTLPSLLKRPASAAQSTGAADAYGSAHLALGHLDLFTTWPRFTQGSSHRSVPVRAACTKRRGHVLNMVSQRLLVLLVVAAALSGAVAQKFDGKDLSKCMTVWCSPWGGRHY